jgi:hypothetical protein
MSPSTLTRRRPAAAAAGSEQLLVLEPMASAADLQPVILAPGRYHLGSDQECDIHVPIAGVASRHCLIVVGPSRSVVKSLSPFTWLNDGVLREAALRPGDRLIAGPIEWTVGTLSSAEQRQPATDAAIEVLWDDANSRVRVVAGGSRARRDWEPPASGGAGIGSAADTRESVIRSRTGRAARAPDRTGGVAGCPRE